jgi:hypothetical protein
MDLALQNTEAYFRAAAAILAMRPDPSEPDMSAALLKRHYGLTGSIATLSSEVERTVEVNLSEGRRLILKTSTRPEAVDSFRFQAAAIAGLQGAAGFVAPEVLRTNTGALMLSKREYAGTCRPGLKAFRCTKRCQLPTCFFELAALWPACT